MRQTRDVRLSVILTVSDDLSMHTHACAMGVKLAGIGAIGSHTLAHLEQGVHLLLGAHLVAQDAVVAQIAWLVDV